MWIDSHCHLDFMYSKEDLAVLSGRLKVQLIEKIIVPSVSPENLDRVINLASNHNWCDYALGFHPLFLENVGDADLEILDNCINQNKPLAIGEIGLDLFSNDQNFNLQETIFVAQLKLAKKHDLPVIMHVRGAIDQVLKNLRRYNVKGGVAHAFNGSTQQATQFIDMGFKLGFGGAMTYARARHLQFLAKTLPLESILLETDAPDIAPEWLKKGEKNSPEQLPKIGRFLAKIRGLKMSELAAIVKDNTYQAFPNLVKLYT